MSQEDPKDARTRFWSTPELVDRVVSFLDLESNMLLARSNELALKVVQRPSVWNKLIRQSGLQPGNQEHSGAWRLLAAHKDKLKKLETLYMLNKDKIVG